MTKSRPAIGSIGWVDLTVEHADRVRDFYKQVVGWTVTDLDMGGYSDYCMNQPGDGKTAAGVCYAKGSNAGLPPVWLIYITVESLEKSKARAVELGGKILHESGGAGDRFCVIEDPAGAVAALFQPGVQPGD